MLVMCHSLKNVKAVDSDGEESLINANELPFFMVSISDALFMSVIYGNLSAFSASAKQEVIRAIFRWKLHSTYYQGVLVCS